MPKQARASRGDSQSCTFENCSGVSFKPVAIIDVAGFDGATCVLLACRTGILCTGTDDPRREDEGSVRSARRNVSRRAGSAGSLQPETNMSLRQRSFDTYASRLQSARERAALIDGSESYDEFVKVVRRETPWRFKGMDSPERYLHNVDHHLRNFVPKVLACVDGDIRTVFDFGCGSGSGSIALAMIFPEWSFHGVDISTADLTIARARARLYGVSDRCQFESIDAGQALPVPGNVFDLCICCSVLEYVTDPGTRKLCVQEMARVVTPGGLLFMTVPNRLYPIEIHSRKLGWNYLPRLLKARIVGSSMWEVRALARPSRMKAYRTPFLRLFTPWTDFCLRKEPDREYAA